MKLRSILTLLAVVVVLLTVQRARVKRSTPMLSPRQRAGSRSLPKPLCEGTPVSCPRRSYIVTR